MWYFILSLHHKNMYFEQKKNLITQLTIHINCLKILILTDFIDNYTDF